MLHKIRLDRLSVIGRVVSHLLLSGFPAGALGARLNCANSASVKGCASESCSAAAVIAVFSAGVGNLIWKCFGIVFGLSVVGFAKADAGCCGQGGIAGDASFIDLTMLFCVWERVGV